jgi:hypothetical protein
MEQRVAFCVSAVNRAAVHERFDDEEVCEPGDHRLRLLVDEDQRTPSIAVDVSVQMIRAADGHDLSQDVGSSVVDGAPQSFSDKRCVGMEAEGIDRQSVFHEASQIAPDGEVRDAVQVLDDPSQTQVFVKPDYWNTPHSRCRSSIGRRRS